MSLPNQKIIDGVVVLTEFEMNQLPTPGPDQIYLGAEDDGNGNTILKIKHSNNEEINIAATSATIIVADKDARKSLDTYTNLGITPYLTMRVKESDTGNIYQLEDVSDITDDNNWSHDYTETFDKLVILAATRDELDEKNAGVNPQAVGEPALVTDEDVLQFRKSNGGLIKFSATDTSPVAALTIITDNDHAVKGYALFSIPDNWKSEISGNGVTSLAIGSIVTDIGSGAFQGLTGIQGQLIIPNSVTGIGAYAFEKCSGFRGDLVLPDSVEIIGEGAFARLWNLDQKLELSNNLSYIPSHAFYSGKYNNKLVIPDSVTGIDNSAFYGCWHLTGLKLSENLKYIGPDAFKNCNNITGHLTIPSSVRVIETSGFSNCARISSFFIESGVEYIGTRAFENVGNRGNLRGDLIIPDTVTGLGPYAFTAFGSSTSLSGKLILSNNITEIPLYCFANVRYTGNLKIPDSVVNIGSNAFNTAGATANGQRVTLTLSNNLTGIGDSAFGMSPLGGELIIPDSVIHIGNSAFTTTSITSVKLGTGVRFVGQAAFAGNNLTSGTLTLPPNLTGIGFAAFASWANASGSIIIPDSVISLPMNAFYQFGQNNPPVHFYVNLSSGDIHKDAFSNAGSGFLYVTTGKLDSFSGGSGASFYGREIRPWLSYPDQMPS